jgi:non-ribosomal peptide synthase protein (TIGR01720 family)
VASDFKVLQLLEQGKHETVGEVRSALAQPNGSAEIAIDPAQLWSLEEEFPYRVRIRWSGGPEGAYEAVLVKRGAKIEETEWEALTAAERPGREKRERLGWGEYGSDPMRSVKGEQLELQLRRYLKERLPEYMVPSIFVMMDELPLSLNGKVNRRALPAPTLNRPELGSSFSAPNSPVEQTLAKLWAQVLKLEQVGVNDNFFELGGDSILSIQIVAKASREGLRLTPKDLFQHQTIAELAGVVDTSFRFEADQGLVEGEFPLTPIQHWFFDSELSNPNHYNQSVLLQVPVSFDFLLLEQVVNRLLLHHDALRLRFPISADLSQMAFNPVAESHRICTSIDLSNLLDDQQKQELDAIATECQQTLDLLTGPLMRVIHFHLGDEQPGRVLIIIHHLAVDGVSWRILLEDLERGYEQALRGAAIEFAAKTTSYREWAQRLSEYVQSDTLAEEQKYWVEMAERKVKRLPVDHERGENRQGSAEVVRVSLSEEETKALLTEVPEVYHTQINEVLMTAVGEALARWTGAREVKVEIEGHGREEIDEGVNVSRTVGWFTSLYPVVIEMPKEREEGIALALKSVKEQLRAIPNGGVGYGMLRYMNVDEEVTKKLRETSQAEVIFNYLGQFDQVQSDEEMLFRIARESSGVGISEQGNRAYLLEINGSVTGGRLWMGWNYSTELHRRETIEAVAKDFITSLRNIIAHCRTEGAGGFTPSDFPLAQLAQDQLDKALASIAF